MYIEVVPARLRRDGAALDATSDGLRGDLTATYRAPALDHASNAGWGATAANDAVVTVATAVVSGLVGRASGFADALRAAACGYEHADERAARWLPW
jgi:hypothetical protein